MTSKTAPFELAAVLPCRRMWSLLQLHAKGCQAANCPVPRCRELREMRRRQIARAEDQRRVGYQQLLRNQAMAASRAPSGTLLMPSGPQESLPGMR